MRAKIPYTSFTSKGLFLCLILGTTGWLGFVPPSLAKTKQQLHVDRLNNEPNIFVLADENGKQLARLSVELYDHTIIKKNKINFTVRNNGYGSPNVAWVSPMEGDGRCPRMPQLEAKLLVEQGEAGALKVKWRMKVAYPRRGEQDNILLPSNSEGNTKLPIDEVWKICECYKSGLFFGGEGTISFQLLDEDEVDIGGEQSVRFRILGANPDPDRAEEYIIKNQGIFWYAFAIAKEESLEPRTGHTYNQFNTIGRYANEPNFGYPGGWGMFQRDSAGGGDPVDIKEVWSWQENVDAAITKELPQKRKVCDRYFERVRSRHPIDYEEPPTLKMRGVNLPGRDALTILLYNGTGKKSLDEIWKFDANAPPGRRWSWRPPNAPKSDKDYVTKVFEQF